MVRGLLMLSVETSDVSSVPAAKCGRAGRRSSVWSASQSKMRSIQKYCAPTFEAEVLPLRIIGIGRRLHRVRTDVAEAARHADAIWLDQIFRSRSKPGRCSSAPGPTSSRPLRRSRDSERAAVPRCRSHSRRKSPTGMFLPRAPILTPGYFCSFSNGSAAQSERALVEPQPEALRIGPRRLLEAGLVDQTEVFPAIIAAEYLRLGWEEIVFRKSSAPTLVTESLSHIGRCRPSRRSRCYGP